MTATILQGDVLQVLRTLPSDHFGCVITSPPYYGLRDYGVTGQMGLEASVQEHVAAMVAVFDEVKRVLHPSGTAWVNYGDCWATTPNGRSAEATKAAGNDDRTYRNKPFSTVSGAIKPKDLCLVPQRFMIAMQEAGWWVRSDITWGKPNGMPDSSAVYRPGSSHERIILFAKSDRCDWFVDRGTGELRLNPDLTERRPLTTKPDHVGPRWTRLGHYYDAAAVMQGRATTEDGKAPDGWDTGEGGHGSIHRAGREKGAKITGKPHVRHSLGEAIPEKERRDKQRGHSRRHNGLNDRWDQMTKEERQDGGRFLRNYEPAPAQVWEIATRPFRESHFATFPPELVERCLRAGAPPGLPILDPFGGSGTTALVADAYGYDSTLIELNPEYIALARRRLAAGLVRMDQPATPGEPKKSKDDRQGCFL
ncbi:MAG: DNA-methyltransferase [Beijerinckiaceae bacterium]